MTGQYWNYSWNIAPGCTKTSPECDHCWAAWMARRLGGMRKPGYEGLVDAKGNWTGRVNMIPDRLNVPLDLTVGKNIAVNLMGDLFHDKISDDFIAQVFAVMRQANWHMFLVLTKRPARVVDWLKGWGNVVLDNVMLGTTAGLQSTADLRWPAMAWIARCGWSTWVSSEPRLEAIDWHGWEFLDWMVTGGESGKGARVMAPAWALSDREWCAKKEIPFWFKQWGCNALGGLKGDLLDGRVCREIPVGIIS